MPSAAVGCRVVVANCGYGHGYSVKEVLHAMEEITGKPLPVRIMDRRASDPSNLTAAADLIRQHLDWTPQYDDLRAIIETALAWERRIAATGLAGDV